MGKCICVGFIPVTYAANRVKGCFAMYERTVDPMVRLFVPFYDEVKSLVILFFLLTRARVSVRILLFSKHVILIT